MSKKVGFLKTRWGHHYFTWLIVFIVFTIVISYTQILSYNILLHVLLILVLIFYFVVGHLLLFNFINTAKPFFEIIIGLNNYNYWQKSRKRNIPILIFTIPIYLIIFQTYFIALGKYNFAEALIFGWIILIFVRCSHYADYNLGKEIGTIIGSFFIPFGFLIFLVNAGFFIQDFSLGIIDHLEIISSFLIFILFLLAYIPLEVLMDYKSAQNKNKRIKSEWAKDPNFVKYR